MHSSGVQAEPFVRLVAFGVVFLLTAHIYLESIQLQWIDVVGKAGIIAKGIVLTPFQSAPSSVIGSDALVGQSRRKGLHLKHGHHERAQKAKNDDDEHGLNQSESRASTRFVWMCMTRLCVYWFRFQVDVVQYHDLVSASGKIEYVNLPEEVDPFPLVLQCELQCQQG